MTSKVIDTSRAVRPRQNSTSQADLNARAVSSSRPWTGSASTPTTRARNARSSATAWPKPAPAGLRDQPHRLRDAARRAAGGVQRRLAVQIKCTNDPDKPVDLQLWGGDEFTVFTDPEDPRQPFAVVTIDRYKADAIQAVVQ